MDLTLDAARLSPMLGRNDLYAALLDAMQERRGAHESAGVLKLRLQRALQGREPTGGGPTPPPPAPARPPPPRWPSSSGRCARCTLPPGWCWTTRRARSPSRRVSLNAPPPLAAGMDLPAKVLDHLKKSEQAHLAELQEVGRRLEERRVGKEC